MGSRARVRCGDDRVGEGGWGYRATVGWGNGRKKKKEQEEGAVEQ